MENQVTAATAKVGLAVEYRKAPKAVPFETVIISSPRKIGDVLCVNVAMIGEPVPLETLTEIKKEV